jgi:multidrug transporter EmrE-like cation transporter
MNWFMLFVAIACEVFATTCLKLTAGYTKPMYLIGSIIGYPMSFLFFGFSLKEIDISIAYALWSGIGVLGTCIIGSIFFSENIGFQKMICIFLITVGIIALNFKK